MRDILNILDSLHTDLLESRGMAGRKTGDKFVNSADDVLEFQSLTFYPDGGGKYTPDELSDILTQISDKYPNLQWLNAKSSKTGGIGIVHLTGQQGDLFVGRFFDKINPNPTDNNFPNEVGEYRFKSGSSEKMRSGLTPQDLLQGEKYNLTVSDIMNQLAKSMGTDHPLYAVAHKLAIGEGLPIEFSAPNDINFSAFRDYFCEILQPIALQVGSYSGNAGEAAEIFLDGTFDGTLISFDDSKNAGLSDSTMTNKSGKTIKVSSKGGAGAKASAKNLLDVVEELRGTPNGTRLVNRYKNEIELIENIVKHGQAGSPLWLGVKFGVITEQDAQMVKALKDYPVMNLKNIESLKISDNLKELALGRGTNTPDKTLLYYHLMAAIAFKAADAVNEGTNFSKAASDILNNGALVQVYTKATAGDKTWRLDDFATVYPGDSIKGVYLSAGKTYYSTGIKGNYTFMIDKGKGVAKNDDNTATKPNTIDDTDFVDKASKLVRENQSNAGRRKR